MICACRYTRLYTKLRQIKGIRFARSIRREKQTGREGGREEEGEERGRGRGGREGGRARGGEKEGREGDCAKSVVELFRFAWQNGEAACHDSFWRSLQTAEREREGGDEGRRERERKEREKGRGQLNILARLLCVSCEAIMLIIAHRHFIYKTKTSAQLDRPVFKKC